MPSGGSSRRYSQAVFDIAREQDTLDQWRDDLQTVADVLGLPDVQTFVESPRVTQEIKQQLLDQHLGSVAPFARKPRHGSDPAQPRPPGAGHPGRIPGDAG